MKDVGDLLACRLTHRGPDDGGRKEIDLRRGRSLLLIHRRLSIIDLSPAGHQPMEDPETGNHVVYNGEIYNFRNLRAGILGSSRFRSQSDTEVLLKGYAAKGLGILDHLCGMFAFALWDTGRQRLFLAVDPLGIKPLYYWSGPDGRFAFASEMRALMGMGLIPRRIDPNGLESYLSYGAAQAPHTIISGIRMLLPGTFITVDADGRIGQLHRYWKPPFDRIRDGVTQETAAEEVRVLLDQVVSEHLISDVPVGAFLSGGIDSSALVVIAAKHSRDLRTFSISFPETEYSEAPYSRQLARTYGLKHTDISLSENDLLSQLPAAFNALDQPTLDGTNVFVISHAVRQTGVTVALSGQGGDEVFAGYSTFGHVALAARWRQRLRLVPKRALGALGATWREVQSHRRSIPDKLGQYLSGDGSAFSTYFLLRQLFPPSTRRELFPEGGAGITAIGLPFDETESLLSDSVSLEPINLVSLLELRTYLGNMLLRDGDVMSMAHGLEVRVPFLDRRVLDLVARFPGSIKMEGEWPKPILLKALGAALPPEIYQRPKQGFTFPWEHWLRQKLNPLAAEALQDADTFKNLGMDPTAVQRLWKDFEHHRIGISWSRIWSLIILREWATRLKATL